MIFSISLEVGPIRLLTEITPLAIIALIACKLNRKLARTATIAASAPGLS